MTFTQLDLDTTSTTTEFRVWGSAIAGAIATQGWVQTGDTGQINWSTVTTAAANTSYGYEIWRMADALQATHPVFLKLEYGTGAKSTPYCPQMWATVGTGSDGAGTLTSHAAYPGTVSTRRSFLTTGASFVNRTGKCYVQGDTSSLVIALWPPDHSLTVSGYHVTAGVFFIERTRDENSTNNSNGFCTHWTYTEYQGTAGTCYNQLFRFISGTQPVETAYGQAEFQSMSSLAGTGGYPSRIRTGTVPAVQGAHKYVLSAFTTDFSANETYTITHQGSSGSWRALGRGNGMSTSTNTTWTGYGLLHRGGYAKTLLIKE